METQERDWYSRRLPTRLYGCWNLVMKIVRSTVGIRVGATSRKGQRGGVLLLSRGVQESDPTSLAWVHWSGQAPSLRVRDSSRPRHSFRVFRQKPPDW